MADVIYRCRICKAPFPRLIDVRHHVRREHPPTGVPLTRQPAGPRKARRIEEVSGPPGSAPIASEHGPDTPPVTPEPSAPTPERPSRPRLEQRAFVISPEQRQQSVGDAIRDAMPLDVFATIIRDLSIAISQADGAGEAGYLSPIQSTQIAVLLYDATVDLVVTRFRGDVTMFKATLAILLILIAKGRVHAAAISTRMREGRQLRQQAQIAADLGLDGAASANGTGPELSTDPVAAAMRLQRTRVTNEETIG